MAEALPVKRQRTDTTGDASRISASASAIPRRGMPLNCLPLIDKLPKETMSNILNTAAISHPDVRIALIAAYQKMMQDAADDEVIDFAYLSKAAWKALNVTYARLSMARQHEVAFEAVDSIRDCISKISKETSVSASYGTKLSALETLRKIGKTITLKPMDEIGKAVIQHFEYDSCLEDTMLRIAKGLSAEECAGVLSVEFECQLKELEGLAGGQCIFTELKEVRETLEEGASAP